MKRTILLAALLWPLLAPQSALAPTAPSLQVWQAKRISRSHAAVQGRPGFRVERTIRLDRYKIRVCWSEPGYLLPIDGRDTGCDVVELRRSGFWLYDDSILGAGWLRWL